MTEEQKKKYKLLKEKNKIRMENDLWKNDLLFQECISSLENCKVPSLEEQTVILEKFRKIFPITISGSIDWKNFNGAFEKVNISFIYEKINLQDKYYILW